MENSEEEELKLMRIAEQHPNDEVSAKAMQDLRSKYDETYFWCDDCDGIVTTEANCCMNRPIDGVSSENIIFDF